MREVASKVTTGKKVVLCEPLFWGKKVAVFDMELERHGSRWTLTSAITSKTLPTNTEPADPEVAAAVQEQHDTVVAYVNSVVGTSAVAMTATRAVVEDVPIIDFINYVQATHRQGGADRRRREPAGDLDRRAVQPGGVVPAG